MATHWDLAEFTDQEGRLGKQIPPGYLLIPGRIWLEGDDLNWHISPDCDFSPTFCLPPKGLLNDFVKLWRAPEKRILAFAQKNGVLQENPNSIEDREPLGRWRQLSRKVCALLNVGAELGLGKRRITRDEWKCIGLFDEKRLDSLETPAGARDELRLHARSWVRDVGFSVRWNRARPGFELEVDYHGLMLNAVGLQLALTLANSDDLYICSGCGMPYARSAEKRRPKVGQANFCDGCGTAVALRQADARRKAKMIEARRLHASEVSVNDIAERIDTSPASVRRWVRKGNRDEPTKAKATKARQR